MQPEADRLHLLFGPRQIARSDILERVKLHLLKADHLPVDPHLSVRHGHAIHIRRLKLIQLLDLGVIDRIREVIACHAPSAVTW